MKKRLIAHTVPVLVLWSPIILFYNSILFWGESITGGDFINQFVPWRQFALTELSEGRLPGWNPYVFNGTPFLANIQNSIGYPLNILHFVFPIERVFSLSLVLHHLIAALGMYLFLNALFRDKPGAVIGALVYTWSGFLITHAHDGHLIHVRAYACIPFVLWAQMGLRICWSWKAITGMTLAIALMFYGGHTQIPLYIFYVVLFRSVWWGWCAFRESKSIQNAAAPLTRTLCVLLLSIVISLPLLLPLYQLSKHTASRAGGAEYTFAVSDSMPPAHAVTLFAPFFYGDPTALDRESQFWETRTGFHEICGYTGIIPIVLSLLIWMRRNPSNKESHRAQTETYFFAGLAFCGVFFALGEYNPLYSLLYYGLPGWSFFRVPGRLLLLWIMGISVCSARGWQLWNKNSVSTLRESSGLKSAVVLSVTIVVMTVILMASKSAVLSMLREFEVNRTMETFNLPASSRLNVSLNLPQELFETRYSWMLSSSSTACMLIGLGWIAMLAYKRWKFAFNWLPVTLLILFDVVLFSHRFVDTKPLEEWRETFFPDTVLTQYLLENSKGYRVLCLDDAIGHPGIEHHPELRPNRLMYYGIETARGYDPLILQTYTRWVNRMYGLPPENPQGGLLFFPSVTPAQINQLNVMNVKYIVTAQELAGPYTIGLSESSSPIKVYENPQCFERLFFENNTSEHTILITDQNAQSITATVSCDEPNRLVYSQVIYPGWHVEMDGESQTIHPYLDTFLSVMIPAGQHEVTFHFQQQWVP